MALSKTSRRLAYSICCGALILISACTPGSHYHLTEEDDWLDIPGIKNKDRNYTQGIKLTAESADRNQSYSVGQAIYTPEHKHLSDPLPTERPYAGYLYGEKSQTYLVNEDTINLFRLQAGIVGPHSYAEQVQSGFHSLIGDSIPQGWDHQLHDEPALNVFLEQKRKALLYDSAPITLDVVTNYGVDLGNVSTLTRVGALFRIGKLPNDFGPVVISPRAKRDEVQSSIFTREASVLTYYIFTGSESRAVARNIFLDGNTFRGSASVNKIPLVADIKGGFSFGYGPYRLTYTLVHITDEWTTQQHGMDFGSISLDWDW